MSAQRSVLAVVLLALAAVALGVAFIGAVLSVARRSRRRRWLWWWAGALAAAVTLGTMGAVVARSTPVEPDASRPAVRALRTPSPTATIVAPTISAVFPSSIGSGCSASTPAAGNDGLRATESRACQLASTTVYFTRWASVGDSRLWVDQWRRGSTDPDFRTWADAGGTRQGVWIASTLENGLCHAVAGYDERAYSVELTSPTCSQAESALSAFPLPGRDSVPD